KASRGDSRREIRKTHGTRLCKSVAVVSGNPRLALIVGSPTGWLAQAAVHSPHQLPRGHCGQSLTPRFRALSRAVRLSITAAVTRIRPVVGPARRIRILDFPAAADA